MAQMYLSFCDQDKPKGQQFLGACIVEGANIAEATLNAWRLGINPGGEVLGVPVPLKVPEKFVNRLMTRGDIAEMDKVMLNQKRRTRNGA